MQLCTRHGSRSDIYYSKNDHHTLPDRRHGHGTATNTTWTGAVRRARRSDSRHHKLLYSHSYLPALTPEQIHPISRGVGDAGPLLGRRRCRDGSSSSNIGGAGRQPYRQPRRSLQLRILPLPPGTRPEGNAGKARRLARSRCAAPRSPAPCCDLRIAMGR